ncbi:MAG: type III-B CRISPR-associated protein Cas10/Cmr2 [Thermodesulfovibrio sp.]|nr:type III-B CRISPR-associated protein Cas10/Cmr2 [Thermodesulfovibrio sp.]
MREFERKLKIFLHDPVDKCFNIPNHIERAKEYAKILGLSYDEEIKGSDWIASCMERGLLPKDIMQTFNEIRHPFCEGLISIPENINVEDVFKNVKDALKKVYSVLKGDDKEKFFCLWRNLQEIIFEECKEKDWIKYLSLLPADTRIPDHSIWEHLKIASAINASWDENSRSLLQNNSLFLFTIGPVQSFISQARKTQDFYMGSFILSFLTFKALEVIIKTYGPTNIIYPDLYKQPLMDWWIIENLKLQPYGYQGRNLKLPTIPNRFVAIMPTSETSEIEEIAGEMKTQIKKLIEDVKNVIFSKSKLSIQNKIKEKIDSQLSEFPEVYWVALPWKIDVRDVSIDDFKDIFEETILEQYRKLWDFAEKNGEHKPNIGLNYELLYSILEKFIGGRKNLRKFSQPEVEEKGRKCSVCGERDVVFFRESKNKGKFTNFNKYLIDLTENTKISPKFLADGEGLCSLCFLKRTFEIYLEEKVSKIFKEISFPSTAEISCLDFKEKALAFAKSEYEDYEKRIKELFKDFEKIESSWFYEENLSERYIKDEYGISIEPNKLKDLKDVLKKIYDKVGKPKSYYAIIHLDGDNMGKWLSGELLPEIENSYNSEVWNIKLRDDFKKGLKNIFDRKPLTPAIHASISTALRNYALEFVKKIVEEEHLGRIVYAGGDDVLAFVNLRDLFDVMHKLRWSFSGHIRIENGKIKVDLNNKTGFVEKDGRYLLTMGQKATASLGVVIAHYKTPLQIVIKKVFEMENIAKDRGRDGFAICLMRRSGEERVVEAKWLYENRDTMEILKELLLAFDEKNQNGYIAKSLIQKIATNFVHLKENGKFNTLGEIFNVELLRLLERSYHSSKGIKIKKDERDSFLHHTYEKMKNLFWDTGEDIDNFVNLCTILIFILKAED